MTMKAKPKYIRSTQPACGNEFKWSVKPPAYPAWKLWICPSHPSFHLVERDGQSSQKSHFCLAIHHFCSGMYHYFWVQRKWLWVSPIHNQWISRHFGFSYCSSLRLSWRCGWDYDTYGWRDPSCPCPKEGADFLSNLTEKTRKSHIYCAAFHSTRSWQNHKLPVEYSPCGSRSRAEWAERRLERIEEEWCWSPPLEVCRLCSSIKRPYHRFGSAMDTIKTILAIFTMEWSYSAKIRNRNHLVF